MRQVVRRQDSKIPQKHDYWEIMCPACKRLHTFTSAKPGHDAPEAWSFNRNTELPTVTPSLRVFRPGGHRGDKEREREDSTCHFWIAEGFIRFADDCTHSCKGQTLPMIPVDAWEDTWHIDSSTKQADEEN